MRKLKQHKRKLLVYLEFRDTTRRRMENWGVWGGGRQRNEMAVEAGSRNYWDILLPETIWTKLFRWADSNCNIFSLFVSVLKMYISGGNIWLAWLKPCAYPLAKRGCGTWKWYLQGVSNWEEVVTVREARLLIEQIVPRQPKINVYF